jgi:hypothetical protein
VQAHGSKAVAIVGHHDCTGNPVDDVIHREQIERSFELLKTWSLGVRLLGLWVNKRWMVEVLCDSEGAFA